MCIFRENRTSLWNYCNNSGNNCSHSCGISPIHFNMYGCNCTSVQKVCDLKIFLVIITHLRNSMPFRNNSRSLKRVHHGECEPHIYEEMGDVGQGKL